MRRNLNILQRIERHAMRMLWVMYMSKSYFCILFSFVKERAQRLLFDQTHLRSKVKRSKILQIKNQTRKQHNTTNT